jgi:hypothetical protein
MSPIEKEKAGDDFPAGLRLELKQKNITDAHPPQKERKKNIRNRHGGTAHSPLAIDTSESSTAHSHHATWTTNGGSMFQLRELRLSRLLTHSPPCSFGLRLRTQAGDTPLLGAPPGPPPVPNSTPGRLLHASATPPLDPSHSKISKEPDYVCFVSY